MLVESVQLEQRMRVLLSGKVNLAVQIHAWLRRDMLFVSLAWKLSCWNTEEWGRGRGRWWNMDQKAALG